MNTKYGNIDDLMIKDYKRKLHSKIHWLLIYKENNECECFEDYFISLMKYINALCEIFNKNSVIIDLMATLQIAYNESQSDNYNYKTYRKYVLDAHNIVDKL